MGAKIFLFVKLGGIPPFRRKRERMGHPPVRYYECIHRRTYTSACTKTFLKEHFDNSACSVFGSLQLLLIGVVELGIGDGLAAGDGEVGDVG
jgi:hypothetical protein